MQTKIRLRADFSRNCTDSQTALDITKTIIGNRENFDFIAKHTRRDTRNGPFVEFTVLYNEHLTDRNTVEDILDDVHAAACSRRTYEHIELIEFEPTPTPTA